MSDLADSDDIIMVEPEDKTKQVKKTNVKNTSGILNSNEDAAQENSDHNGIYDDDKINLNKKEMSEHCNNNNKNTESAKKSTAVMGIGLNGEEEPPNSNNCDKATTSQEATVMDTSNINKTAFQNGRSNSATTVFETVNLPKEIIKSNIVNVNKDSTHTAKEKSTNLNKIKGLQITNNVHRPTSPTPIVTIPHETIDLDEEISLKSTCKGNKSRTSATIDLDQEEAPRYRNDKDISNMVVDTIDLEDSNTNKSSNNNINGNKTRTFATIDLDKEETPRNRNDKNTTNMAIDTIDLEDTSNNNDADKEKSFAMLLKNNAIMNKIVQKCLTMENNAGMPRVINKTLLPLYKDANNTFKVSESFTYILKRTWHNLKCDENHKFLHLKSLCDELQAGKFKRKVPFVTLTTDVEKRKTRHKNHGSSKFKDYLAARRKKVEKQSLQNGSTDVIDLDITDDEPIIAINDENSSDDDVVMVSERTHSKSSKRKRRKTKKKLKNVRPKTAVTFNKRHKKRKICTTDIRTDGNHCIVIDNSDPGVSIVDIENEASSAESANECNNIQIDHSDSEQSDNASEKTDVDNDDKSDSERMKVSSNRHNQTDREESRNKNGEETAENSNNESSEESIDVCTVIASDSSEENDGSNKENTSHSKTESVKELLVPHNSVSYKQYNNDFNKAIAIENQIKVCKQKIKELEEMEVINDSDSPYILCDRYKAEIVKLYKRLCQITGKGDYNIHKQRVVRLHVVEGHPPGPVKRLEKYLNSTIDETGAIPLPDFHDVVKCVELSNQEDGLGWTKPHIMKEALALFTHCGHALRKKRQRREYKDLLSLVKEEQLDEYDPAEEDPELLAKLQENQLIAKANEDEIMDRFARMESNYIDSRWCDPTSTNHPVRTRIIENNDSSDSDSDSEVDRPRKGIKTNIIHNHQNNRESSEKEKHNESAPKKPIQTPSNITSPTGESLRVHDELNEISDRINTTQNTTPSTSDAVVNRKPLATPHNQPLCVVNVTSLAYNTPTHNSPNNLLNNTQNINSPLIHSNNKINTNINNANNFTIMPNSTATSDSSSHTDVPTVPTYIEWNTLQKIGHSNTYVMAINKSDTYTNAGYQVAENDVNIVNTQLEKSTEQLMDTNVSDNLANTTTELNNTGVTDRIKTEIKEEVSEIDIQKLFDELGDNYIMTVFDIEDPFVAIDISSDTSSDDDL